MTPTGKIVAKARREVAALRVYAERQADHYERTCPALAVEWCKAARQIALTEERMSQKRGES